MTPLPNSIEEKRAEYEARYAAKREAHARYGADAKPEAVGKTTVDTEAEAVRIENVKATSTIPN